LKRPQNKPFTNALSCTNALSWRRELVSHHEDQSSLMDKTR
jgi:hypothetical protein